ncbi:hypothetical protein [Corynebacterium sp. HMSC08D02]|nr:hypothetical protein [Corynebacterium sp. HMSC08D02]
MTTATVALFIIGAIFNWHPAALAAIGACAILCLTLDTRTLIINREA